MIPSPFASLAIFFRIMVFTSVFTGPAAVFAFTQIGSQSEISAAGLVIYVSLQRA